MIIKKRREGKVWRFNLKMFGWVDIGDGRKLLSFFMNLELSISFILFFLPITWPVEFW